MDFIIVGLIKKHVLRNVFCKNVNDVKIPNVQDSYADGKVGDFVSQKSAERKKQVESKETIIYETTEDCVNVATENYEEPENVNEMKPENNSLKIVIGNNNTFEENKSLLLINRKRKAEKDMNQETKDDTITENIKKKKSQDCTMDCTIDPNGRSKDIQEQIAEYYANNVDRKIKYFEKPKLKVGNDDTKSVIENNYAAEETRSVIRNSQENYEQDMDQVSEDDFSVVSNKNDKYENLNINSAINSAEENLIRNNQENYEQNMDQKTEDDTSAVNNKNDYEVLNMASAINYVEENMIRKNQEIPEQTMDQEAEDNTAAVNNIEEKYEDRSIDSSTTPERMSVDFIKIVNRNLNNFEENKKRKVENPKRKTVANSPLFEMVLDGLRSIRKRNGTSVEEISNFIEQNYSINANINRIKPHIKRLLQNGVADGLFDVVRGSGKHEKFKIRIASKNKKRIMKVTENVKKVPRKNKTVSTKAKKVPRSVKKNRKVRSMKKQASR